MILVVAELVIPLMAGLFVYKLVVDGKKVLERAKTLYIGAGIFAFFTILVALNPDLFFEIPNQVPQQNEVAQTLSSNEMSDLIFQSDDFFSFYGTELYNLRSNVIKKDALKGLFFIAVIFGLIYLLLNDKIKQPIFLVGTALIVLIEMVPIAVMYLNNDKNESGELIYWAKVDEELKPYVPNGGDMEILKMETLGNENLSKLIDDKVKSTKSSSDDILTANDINIIRLSALNANTNYRVFSRLRTEGLTSGTRTSYFHKSLGGYHGAKLMRYQELIDFHIEPRVKAANELVLDMLNTKYIIGEAQGPDGKPFTTAVERESALGAAWIVSNVVFLDSANQEMEALSAENGFDPANIAIVNSSFKEKIGNVTDKDVSASIKMDSYRPNKLEYSFNSSKEEFVVFSEIYYENGWQAFIDDEPVDHVRVNYLLRGLKVPSGSHKITFKFERASFSIGSTISLICSIIILLLVVYLLYNSLFKEKTDSKEILDNSFSL
jgi:hypothetical protein